CGEWGTALELRKGDRRRRRRLLRHEYWRWQGPTKAMTGTMVKKNQILRTNLKVFWWMSREIFLAGLTAEKRVMVSVLVF
ncbi:hypothetical protein PgNI_10785, partial [Pyricularia grisea]|uniref:Uncharacterized protein n=1 Tax=Pyricularia grisea TaxID=148305 RepID=A0A6P8AZR7_PYRGI